MIRGNPVIRIKAPNSCPKKRPSIIPTPRFSKQQLTKQCLLLSFVQKYLK